MANGLIEMDEEDVVDHSSTVLVKTIRLNAESVICYASLLQEEKW